MIKKKKFSVVKLSTPRVSRQDVEERDDKALLQSSSESVVKLQSTLYGILTERIRFIGQNAVSRKLEALDYLKRTMKEKLCT